VSLRPTRLFFAWVTLLVLLAAEVAASALPLAPSLRPLLLIFAVAMAGVILIFFMEVERGPSVIRLFAVSGWVWLIILLALGSLDPLTRFTYFNEPGLISQFDVRSARH
jgi:cytochrome c oxidase subunit IV